MPVVVPGLATGSSSSSASSSSTSLPQDESDNIPSSPATQRSDDKNVPASRNRSRNPINSKKQKQKRRQSTSIEKSIARFSRLVTRVHRKSRRQRSTTLRDTPANTSRDSDSERPTQVVSGKHSIFTHFPKDRKCEICKRTKITRAHCRKFTGDAVRRTEKFGDMQEVLQLHVGKLCP